MGGPANPDSLILQPEIGDTIRDNPPIEPTGDNFLGPIVQELIIRVDMLFGESLYAINRLNKFVLRSYVG